MIIVKTPYKVRCFAVDCQVIFLTMIQFNGIFQKNRSPANRYLSVRTGVPPNINVAIYSPPFKPGRQAPDDQSNQPSPDVLCVGMTAPKQEKWIYQNKDKLNVKFIGAVGAVFDFYAGTVRRSSPWFRKHGLEWLPRLLQEPRRLWYRNLVSSPKFLTRVILRRLYGQDK